MNKMLSLRRWVYLEDACKYLSRLFDEEVSVRDVVALTLEGRIPLSVRFEERITGRAATRTEEQPSGKPHENFLELESSPGAFLALSTTVDYLDGIFDLSMLGGEKRFVREFEWNGNPSANGESAWGFAFGEWILRSEDGGLIVLVKRKSSAASMSMDYQNYEFEYGLPVAARLVLRTKAILGFETNFLTGPEKNSLNERERTTLLNIIGALLQAHETKESVLIADLLEKHPMTPGIKKRTLEEKFAEAKRSLRSA